MGEMLFKEECFQLVGFCMEVHQELGRGQSEVLYKDAMEVELSRASLNFSRERKYDVLYKGTLLPHHYFADFVISEKILFEAKAVEKLTDPHLRQTMNYLAISKLRLGLLVNFGGESLEWKRVIL